MDRVAPCPTRVGPLVIAFLTYSRVMKRWFVLLFAVLLPLQFAWAGAAAYCQHETTPSQSRHFGHHEHAHKASAEQPASTKLAGDNDCGTCHAAGAPVMFEANEILLIASASATVDPQPSPALLDALARAPDRPQWLRLA